MTLLPVLTFSRIVAFKPYFSDDTHFQQAIALITATHALSFYSLTLQHGVPFQPVSIRVSKDPIGLISKVLEQNPRSYTKLDDLIDIAKNLVSAGLSGTGDDGLDDELQKELIDVRRKDAERRVTFMAVEAALREDDFETAYSYIVNRLTPSNSEIEVPKHEKHKPTRHDRNVSRTSTHSKAAASDDDVSWRAAFLAGRYRPATSSPPTLRRLEQRTELLSLALLLAPVSALTEILAAWRKCEEEMTSLQLAQQQAEEAFDDNADKRRSMSSIPGTFNLQDEQPAMILNQKRREMGRMGGNSGGDEAPVSMFDLTRSAAQAFSKNAFPLRGATRSASGDMDASVGSIGSDGGGGDGEQRYRKRDLLASTVSGVSGGLASGLGWVLGAPPAHQES
jgi:protein transport protein SEC39